MKQSLGKKTAPTRPSQGFLTAEVLAVVDDDTVMVRPRRAPTEEVVQAEIAVIGYVPVVGDRVVLGHEGDAWFVVGALGEARRRSAHAGLLVTVGQDGGVELRAREGNLTLTAPNRIVLHAAEVETAADFVFTTAAEVVTRAGRVEVDAERLVERAGDAYRHVDGLSELQAGRARTLVEGAYQLVAEKTTITSNEDTIIDGKRVLLG